jgi:hypothetical protein
MTCGCFQKLSLPYTEEDFRILMTSKTECDDSTESYSTTGVPKMFPPVAGTIFGLSA